MADPRTEEDPLLSPPTSPTLGGRPRSYSEDHSIHSGITLQSGTTFQSSIVHTIAESVETFMENANEMMEEITENFVDELEDADREQDRYFFLEMALTRNLSLTPGDVVEASNYVTMSIMPLPDPDAYAEEESSTEDEEDHLPTIQEHKRFEEEIITKEEEEKIKLEVEEEGIPLSAYLLLGSAVISLSAIGPFLDYQMGVSATMKVLWRTLATAIILLPFAATSIHRDGFPRLKLVEWILFVATAAMYAFMCIFFVWSLELTAVGNAVIFSNSQSLLLLVGKMFVGHHVTSLEGTGALVAFSGAILCSKDSADKGSDDTGGGFSTVVGDMYALLSAFAGVAYLVLAKTVRPTMDLYVFMFFVMFVSSIETLICLMIRGEPVSWDFDYNHGILGWMQLKLDRLPLELAMAVVCNLFGAMGYVRAMHYFDNLVISVATLLEPVVAELMASSIGVGFLPHLTGWIGNALVLLGTLAVVYKPPGAAQSHEGLH